MLVSLKQIKRIEKVEKLKKGTYTQHRVSTNIQPREVGLRYSSGVSDFICAAFCALISSGVYSRIFTLNIRMKLLLLKLKRESFLPEVFHPKN